MEISRIISQFLENLRPNESAKPGNAVSEQFQEFLRQQAGNIKQPAKPIPPSASLHLNQSPNLQQFYNKQGQLIELSIFRNQTQAKVTSEMLSAGNQIAQEAKIIPDFKWPSELLATLLQLSFDFIRDQLKRDERQKKRKNKRPILSNGKAEEDALELLEILFDQYEESEDKTAYCAWAHESIQNAENSIREQYTNLPPEVEMRFKIMHDAILALENGIEPDYVKERLRQEIHRKKNR